MGKIKMGSSISHHLEKKRCILTTTIFIFIISPFTSHFLDFLTPSHIITNSINPFLVMTVTSIPTKPFSKI
ncbi:hypothetical protein QVD17_06385 [Tagetes erecta]|uniref:Uncharacterized protein n=1 Tax=Tagetes erecta TaxID=13708 RepID=A0AAD8LK30_TARER|nr:hypothetical protein QVD17_06385 [Tagetes erecta]